MPPNSIGRLSPLILYLALVAYALRPQYHTARRIRIEQGAAAAAPLYRRLLRDVNPSDGTAATRLAAAVAATRSKLAHICCDTEDASHLRRVLEEVDYTTARVHAALGVPPERGRSCVAPLCAAPAAAGSVAPLPWGDKKVPTAVECLTALFLLGLAVPRAALESALTGPQLQVLFYANVVVHCDVHPDRFYALVQIFPLSLGGRELYLLTDWHPKVLSRTIIDGEGEGSGEGAVMYIGPDSLALVQHYLMMDNDQEPDPIPLQSHLLDLCTGSGIQALAALSLGRCRRAVALDVNPRCLRFARFNAALNGLADRLTLVRGDLLRGMGSIWDVGSAESPSMPLEELLQQLTPTGCFEEITANPPFLPVPHDIPEYRHGLFSAGGASGEAVLASVVRLAGRLLAPRGAGTLAVVSEFFLAGPDATATGPLRRRLAKWFHEPVRGLLLTNAAPLDAATYAARRAAGSDTERRVWRDHLESHGIGGASPGLLYLRRGANGEASCIEHAVVPRSPLGSIWSPYNRDAVEFTRAAFIQQCSTSRVD